MVWLTLIIGVLNVCLGFALAVQLGYGPPGLWEAWDVLAQGRVSDHTAEATTEFDAGDLAEMLDDEALADDDDEFETEAYDAIYDDEDGSPASDKPEATQDWNLNEKYVETALLKLNIAMMKSGARATKIDTRLRDCRGRTDAQTIQRCLVELKEDCETYLVEQSEASEKFVERISDLGELAALGEEIEMANLEQSAQVETTLNNLNTMDFETDLEGANSRLLSEIGNLRFARHKLRDQQEVAFLAIARYENRLDKVEQKLFDDALTRLNNRSGLEATLWNWWKQGRHKARQMSAALFDLDEFEHVNEEYGPLMGDRVLHHLAQYLVEKCSDADLVARYAGQQFMVIMMDIGPRAATKQAELIRQSVEKAVFVSEGQEIGITTSLGLTEVSPEDTIEALFERLEKAMKLAKKNGRNCGVFHDKTEMEPVESPNLGAEETRIEM